MKARYRLPGPGPASAAGSGGQKPCARGLAGDPADGPGPVGADQKSPFPVRRRVHLPDPGPGSGRLRLRPGRGTL